MPPPQERERAMTKKEAGLVAAAFVAVGGFFCLMLLFGGEGPPAPREEKAPHPEPTPALVTRWEGVPEAPEALSFMWTAGRPASREDLPFEPSAVLDAFGEGVLH